MLDHAKPKNDTIIIIRNSNNGSKKEKSNQHKRWREDFE
jgi:hypothetical protein